MANTPSLLGFSRAKTSVQKTTHMRPSTRALRLLAMGVPCWGKRRIFVPRPFEGSLNLFQRLTFISYQTVPGAMEKLKGWDGKFFPLKVHPFGTAAATRLLASSCTNQSISRQ